MSDKSSLRDMTVLALFAMGMNYDPVANTSLMKLIGFRLNDAVVHDVNDTDRGVINGITENIDAR